jgi:hypothetical protein
MWLLFFSPFPACNAIKAQATDPPEIHAERRGHSVYMQRRRVFKLGRSKPVTKVRRAASGPAGGLFAR